jgi:hypothetical protein
MLATSRDSLEKWTGGVKELVELVTQILDERGIGGDRPNERLVRYYADSGILSRPWKEGKEARYGRRHVLELVAARYLAADGWPLRKIAEHVRVASDADLMDLIPGEQGGNRALRVAHRLQMETASSRPSPTESLSQKAPAPNSTSSFHQRAARLSAIQGEMRDALRRLGLPDDRPAVERVALIAIAPWCQVLVDSKRLSDITVEEAEELGRALTAVLLDPTIRKDASK